MVAWAKVQLTQSASLLEDFRSFLLQRSNLRFAALSLEMRCYRMKYSNQKNNSVYLLKPP